MIILDTNVLSELLRPAPAPQVLAWLDALGHTAGFVSSVTQAEMLLGVALLPAGKRRDALELNIGALFSRQFSGRCLPFDTQAAPYFARIVANRRKAGKPISAEYAQIAAIACCRGFQLATPTKPTLQPLRVWPSSIRGSMSSDIWLAPLPPG